MFYLIFIVRAWAEGPCQLLIIAESPRIPTTQRIPNPLMPFILRSRG